MERAHFLEPHYNAMGMKLHLLNQGQCARIRTSFEKTYRRLAQLVRALGRHPRGQQFESATAYQYYCIKYYRG